MQNLCGGNQTNNVHMFQEQKNCVCPKEGSWGLTPSSKAKFQLVKQG
jgi:hypothetical protein